MLDLLTLPSVALPPRLTLPDSPGIYFALGSDNEILYIGRARSLARRWQGSHHRRAELDQIQGVRIAWLCSENVESLRGLEQELIAQFKPRLNGNRVSTGSLFLMCRISTDQKNRIRMAAALTGVSVSRFIREALNERLAKLAKRYSELERAAA